LKAILFGSVM